MQAHCWARPEKKQVRSSGISNGTQKETLPTEGSFRLGHWAIESPTASWFCHPLILLQGQCGCVPLFTQIKSISSPRVWLFPSVPASRSNSACSWISYPIALTHLPSFTPPPKLLPLANGRTLHSQITFYPGSWISPYLFKPPLPPALVTMLLPSAMPSLPTTTSSI